MKTIIISFLTYGILTCFVGIPQSNKDSGYKTSVWTIKQDSVEYQLCQVLDSLNRPIFYYRDIIASPCKEKGVCELMKIRLYWDFFGNYMMFSVDEQQPLTKLNHKEFSKKDYCKLHEILGNPYSGLKKLKLDNLTEKEAKREFENTDGVSGATANSVNCDYVKGAIKTTYCLWMLANGETQNEIRKITNSWMKNGINQPKGNDVLKVETNELWNLYLKDKSNLKHLMDILSHEKMPTSDLLTGITKELSKSDELSYYLMLKIFSKYDNLSRKLIASVSEQLEVRNNFKYMLTYNFLLKYEASRNIRNEAVAWWYLEL